ncbi:MAG TPA: hypothetical protein VFO10_18155 [Oligoflexus sp.]|uniref:hypothetical protein n=1 Tax=Oligoflexus sp. TaxID=1971216 RepID=UPI002D7F3AA1|nr:hypothetical protein [Oligoflexus sp.]HET9239189.1 hypothetical protein [Oligoflexus sp.]
MIINDSILSKMDEAQFDRVAVKCRWSERSLNVAKALIVEAASLSEAAAAHTMSPQQANVIRARFLAKAEKMRVEEFMQREKPRFGSAFLPYTKGIQTLRDCGYTIKQIISFLEENGVSVSRSAVEAFFRHRSKR